MRLSWQALARSTTGHGLPQVLAALKKVQAKKGNSAKKENSAKKGAAAPAEE